MVVVDTNILVYAANEDAPEHARAMAFLERLRAQPGPWHLTWGILYEFLRVTTHRRVLARPWTASEAMGFVRALLDSPGLIVLTPTDRHAAMLSALISEVPRLSGNLLFDCQTAALMREHGVRTVYTHDVDFHRFPSVEVVDPLAT